MAVRQAQALANICEAVGRDACRREVIAAVRNRSGAAAINRDGCLCAAAVGERQVYEVRRAAS